MKIQDAMRVLQKIYDERELLTHNDIIQRIRNIITHHELEKKINTFDGRDSSE